MKRVGEILRDERLRLNKTIKAISVETRVQEDFLTAIEQGNYDQLPNLIYTRGFIISFAKALGLDEHKVLPFYRREVEQSEGTDVKKIPKPISVGNFKFSPARLLILVSSIALTIFVVILFLQYRQYSGIPVLLVNFPPDNYVTSQSTIEITGHTDPQATITINGELATIEVNGRFQMTFSLNEDLNRIKIVAKSILGKESMIEKVVEKREEE